MVYFYDSDRITLGDPSYSGHTVYKKAKYRRPSGLFKKIIYKQNKHADLNFSRFEVGFSAMAGRFLLPDLTPKQALVRNRAGQIIGVASEHYCYAAHRREGLAEFYSINMDGEQKSDSDSKLPSAEPSKSQNNQAHFLGQFPVSSAKPKAPEDIPVYFLDQFPAGFFSTLWRSYKDGEIDFDMASLASVLTSSYTLEEDDLHKGNFGFYLVKKQGRMVVVFFKIDNDLMLADSVMSCYGSRITSWSHGDHAFDITVQDLLSFPKLIDSQNHYWPTSKRYLANPIDAKVYSGTDDINAFAELARSRSFRHAKWREFYKHTLIPPEIIKQSLMKAFDTNDAKDRAQLAVIQQAVVARQAKLRAVLFSIPAFRSFVRNLPTAEFESIQREILRGVDDENQALSETILADMKRHYYLCSRNGFADGDTPLHVAIRLKDYRHHETWQAFRQFAEVPNENGEKPLDVAVALAERSRQHNFPDLRQDPFFTIKSLLRAGAEKTDSYRALPRPMKESIANYRFGTDYLSRAKEISTGKELIDLMRDVGEDYRLSLKMRKELSVSCLKQFIRFQQKHRACEEILQTMKVALNGNDEQEPAPELQFIRQLRSRLWIVRQIRGLLGGTGTQVALNDLIDEELSRYQPSCFSLFTFFSCTKEEKTEPASDLGQELACQSSV
ncbi:hypothetical protein BN59_01287 [Legionella massiliensis]|uniref:Uncharacterized protein n=1 Tax=Legionella massiliensis TaxID=1034943 RepID=A0A078KZ66_9GAMM|nr:hypothetical protein BN59_01287 [Legionella massiliensis]CEE12746.1 hypothetical protein BN1094_01287 [Legionella massiliensis]